MSVLQNGNTYVNLKLVTKVAAHNDTVRMWAGDNIEIFNTPVLGTAQISDKYVASLVAKRVALIIAKGDKSEPTYNWHTINSDAIEYALEELEDAV